MARGPASRPSQSTINSLPGTAIMPIVLKVPEVGESITEVQIGTWKKREGEGVAMDDSIVEIESDKATVDLPAPAAGTVTKILKASGEKARVGEVIGYLEPAGSAAAAPPRPPPAVRWLRARLSSPQRPRRPPRACLRSPCVIGRGRQ